MAKKANPHTALVRAIEQLASFRKDVFGWSNNTGAGIMNGRWVSFGLKGAADWIGLSSDGKLLALEVKTGMAKQEPHQKLFELNIKRLGGRYFVVRNVDDARRAFDTANGIPDNSTLERFLRDDA